ncbi:LysR substrate-binding domain-containing protein [Trabulsiella odontotermitis]|uniref:LysR substrate-binding domain-containing protein n=1 Tax=Trabulsiella odontotermitis TaxID=379893 RepID=UPI000675DB57|nr:LysR substrate-binding domain-containing protein [Trabulsiella odontotermitis]KNC89756.1 LysR family transcriptional regulator [Trabulsiella odontotermitis]
MRSLIPKTELLVAFEVVARHESYTRAAEELALTQSAVFRQVLALENFLQTKLFTHVKKRIYLNDAGKYYLPLVRETINKLEHDTHAIMTYESSSVGVINLAVNPTFSTHWLIPNLPGFNKENPDIICNVHSLSNENDFFKNKYDIAIMREDFCPPCSEVEYLFEEEILPVCSLNLWPHPDKKMSANDLINSFTLLHQSTRINGWREWFVLSGVVTPWVSKGPYFDLLSMLIAAVRSNMGVALLPRFAIQRELNNGTMVVPCEVPQKSGNRFIITWCKENEKSSYIRTFNNWLLKKIKSEMSTNF